MKLRIRGNSIRLRVTQSEVASLAGGDPVAETTQVGAAQFGYQLIPDGTALAACYVDNVLSVNVPADQTRAWADSNTVGIEAQLGSLDVLIEKDFACLDPRPGAEDSDTFPNPKAG